VSILIRYPWHLVPLTHSLQALKYDSLAYVCNKIAMNLVITADKSDTET